MRSYFKAIILYVDLPPNFRAAYNWTILFQTVLVERSGSMKTSRYSEQQIASILEQSDEGASVAEFFRKAEISGRRTIAVARGTVD